MKKTGFTLIELLAVIVVLAIILAIAIPGISGIIKSATKSSFESDAKMVLKAVEYKQLENDSFDPLAITKENMQEKIGVSGDKYAQVTFSMVSNKVKVVLVGANKFEGLTAYGTFKDMRVVNSDDYDVVPPVITVIGDNPAIVGKGGTYVEAGATATDLKDGDLTSRIVTKGSVNVGVVGTYTITYTAEDNAGNVGSATRTVNVVKVANDPVLAVGMTPIKWNGSEWVNTTADDTDWYSYAATDKKWANAKTADGSMWVWIPRYIYKISTGWHTNAVGTIDVQFSIETDDTRGGTVTLDTGTDANASNNRWTNHPAFKFGATELTGIWVSKFEASGTTSALDFKPNVASLRNITVGSMFAASRNMETNPKYGWTVASGLKTDGTFTTDTNNVDAHMIKNTEWGAVAYLTQSIYGKNGEIAINDNSSYYTGGGIGDAYATNVAQSTTGNIYGIYDISGGSFEFTASYVNSGHSSLSNYGNNIVTADAKYKNVYTVTTDNIAANYNNAIDKKGDAVYETSNSYTGATSWYTDYSEMPNGFYPWFIRSGTFGSATSAGAFGFFIAIGEPLTYGFRSVLVVGAGF